MDITINIKNIESVILEKLPSEVLAKLSTECSYAIPGAEYSPIYQAGHWDGVQKLFNIRNQTFATGLLYRVRKVLTEYNYTINFNDLRQKPITSELPTYFPYQLRDYQESAARTLIENTRGVIKAATASGKTSIAARIVSLTNVPTLIVTHTSTVFEQFHRNLETYLGMKIGKIGGGECDIQRVTVALIQSLTESVVIESNRPMTATLDANGKPKKIKPKTKTIAKRSLTEFFNGIQCLIIDEAHHIAADGCQLINLACPNAYYRAGCTATPFRDDLADILIERVTGRIIVDITASELIRRGLLPKPIISMIRFKHKRQALTKIDPVTGKASKVKYKEFYDDTIVNNNERNLLIANLARQHIEKNESVLIVVQRIKHGENIAQELQKVFGNKVRFVCGDDDSELLQSTLKELHEKTLLCAIATGVYKEGVDIPSLNVLVIASAHDSSVLSLQLVGRVLRKGDNKDTVPVYDIYDYGCRWLPEHSDNRIRVYKTEEEFVVKEIDYDDSFKRSFNAEHNDTGIPS